MARRWSKLQKRLYSIIDYNSEFQIHCALYEMNSLDGYHTYKLPRYFITIGKDIVFDYPKDFDTTLKYGTNAYPWDCDISDISECIWQYLNVPKEKLLEPMKFDRWGITDIIRVCDKRVGRRRLLKLKEYTENEVLLNIINTRLSYMSKGKPEK